ncbi:TPA: hypothetical protein VBM32_002265 [Streptococcus agalactiae]|nr:hypothetical protein [Streptococcus agalactiae]
MTLSRLLNIDHLYHQDINVGKLNTAYNKALEEIGENIDSLEKLSGEEQFLEKLKDIAFADKYISKLGKLKQQLLDNAAVNGDIAVAQEFIKLNTTLDKLEKIRKSSFIDIDESQIGQELEQRLINLETKTNTNHTNSTWREKELMNGNNITIDRENIFKTYLNSNVSQPPLTAITGVEQQGKVKVRDFSTAPHTLIVGGTGSERTIEVKQIALSIMRHNTPDDVRFVFFDNNNIDYSAFEGNPFLLCDTVTKSEKMLSILKWLFEEYKLRMDKMILENKKSIEGFNDMVANNIDKKLHRGVRVKMPYIFVVIDGLGELLADKEHGKTIAIYIELLLSLGKSMGIHFLISEENVSTSKIPLTILNNLPTKVVNRVPSEIESQNILGESGAEKLDGNGDHLIKWNNGKIEREKSLFFQDYEIHSISQWLKIKFTGTKKLKFD